MVIWKELTKMNLALGVLGGWVIFQVLIKMRSILQSSRLPPGPPGTLILGNLLEMPTHHEWITFAKWAKEFGNLFSLRVLNKRIVVVNSLDVVHELFEKRSSLYSDRPDLPMLNDLMGFDWNLGMMRYGERWRRHRKIFHQYSHPDAAVRYYDVQARQSRILLQRLHKNPEDVSGHFRHLAGAFIMEIAYGIQVQAQDDPYIQLAERAVSGLISAAVPGAFLVDVLPIMKYIPEWVPGASFRKKARIWREFVTGMCVTPFKAVKEALGAGTARTSIAASLLEELSARTDAPADEEEVIRNAVAVAYLGGTDTIATVLYWFILAMVMHPEVQRKAQAQLDSVISSDRLPEFEDREHLPYIDALCKESLRWNPAAPLAIPHRVTEDNFYGEYFIPKGTTVLGNAWAILHDEKAYGANPEEFEPERFLKPGVPEPDTAFGFGRRICPGRYIAENFLFITVASILQVYDIKPAKVANGNAIPVDTSSSSGAICAPHPFKCEIKPRSAAAQKILEELDDE